MLAELAVAAAAAGVLKPHQKSTGVAFQLQPRQMQLSLLLAVERLLVWTLTATRIEGPRVENRREVVEAGAPQTDRYRQSRRCDSGHQRSHLC